MSIVAVYLIACLCRTTLPELGWRLSTALFAIRAGCVGIGLAAAYGFMWFCIHEPHLVRNPDTARIYMFAMVAVGAAIGEFVARKYLRSKKTFPKGQWISWIY